MKFAAVNRAHMAEWIVLPIKVVVLIAERTGYKDSMIFIESSESGNSVDTWASVLGGTKLT